MGWITQSCIRLLSPTPKHRAHRARRPGNPLALSRCRTLHPILLRAAALLSSGLAWAQAAGAKWTTPSGTAQGTRFSSLPQITSSNVGQLQEEFSFKTGVQAGHEGTPLVVGNTMYVVGPFTNRLLKVYLSILKIKKNSDSPGIWLSACNVFQARRTKWQF